MKKIAFLLLLLAAAAMAHGQDGRDSFSLPWPAEYRWRFFDKATGVELSTETKNKFAYEWTDVNLFPETETPTDWTIKGSISRYIQTGENGIDSIKNLILKEEKRGSPSAKLTLLQQNDADRWIIFKITIEDPATGRGRLSKLFFVFKGAWGNTWVASVSIKRPELSDEFVSEWTKVFSAKRYFYW